MGAHFKCSCEQTQCVGEGRCNSSHSPPAAQDKQLRNLSNLKDEWETSWHTSLDHGHCFGFHLLYVFISVASTSWLNRRTIMHQPAVKCVGRRHQLSLDKLDRRQHHVFVPLSWISWNFEVRQLHSNLPITKEQDEMRHTGICPQQQLWKFLSFSAFYFIFN